MCYHTEQSSSAAVIKNQFKLKYPLEANHTALPRVNGFSHPEMAVISNEDEIQINRYSWGLIPFWVKSIEDAKKLSNKTLNAVSETVFEKPSYRDSIVKRRCIIPVTSFFEWQHEGNQKIPFQLKPVESTFFNLAGIYSYWTNPETKENLTTFSILTMPANDLMAEIHNTKKRMPVILPDNLIELWTDPDLSKGSIIDLMKSEVEMEAVKL